MAPWNLTENERIGGTLSVIKQLTARKSVAAINQEIECSPRLNRVLGPVTLTSVGLGAMIGTGIFVLTGTVAAQHTGPAITIAFLVAAIGCGLAALCYAELASMIPICGSAYSYTYATLGEGLAWFVGWNLALEYLMSASAVAVSWSGYVVNLLGEVGVTLPAALTNAPLGKLADGSLGPTGALLNVPAVLIVAALSWLCYIGVQESTRINNIMVAIKISIIILFILVGVSFVDTANWHPYLPQNAGGSGSFGWSGVMTGAAIIFFAYIGFDQAATTAQEARDPQRTVPIGILAALVIATVLYVVMAAVMTGMVPYGQLNVAAPVAVALDAHPELFWLGLPVKIGAIMGMTSVILMSLLGQPRIFMAMSRDGLLLAGDGSGASEIPHAAHRDSDYRCVRGRYRGSLPARRAGRADLDRHPARLRGGLRGRAGAALHLARHRTSVPGAGGVAHLHRGRGRVSRDDALPAARHLDPVADLDGHRLRGLFPLRLSPQPAAPHGHLANRNMAAGADRNGVLKHS